jgi:hypothetical protein
MFRVTRLRAPMTPWRKPRNFRRVTARRIITTKRVKKSASFLKKRSENLLHRLAMGFDVASAHGQSFLLILFKK